MKRTAMKMLALLLLAAMLVACTACGQKAPASPSQQPVEENKAPVADAPQETVTINFWHHYSAQSAENETLTNVLIPQFEKENPGYKVNAVSHEWADLHDKILISASSNTLPDVARLDIAWVPEFQAMDILVPLNKEMEDFDQVAAKLLPSAMSTGVVKGDNYALALNTNTKILFYNVKALEEAGIAVPTTMEELVEAVKALSGDNENGQQVWGLNEPDLAGWNVCPWIWSFGGAITNEDCTKATGYLNSAETVAAIETLAELYNEGAFGGFNSGDIPMTDGFGTNRYMMFLEGPWKSAEMDGAYPDFEYGTSDMPSGKGGSISVLGGEDIAMFNSANREGAWKFMKFMTGAFAEEEMAKCGQIPVNTDALESDTVKAQPFAPFLKAITSAKARPQVATWSEIDNLLKVAVTDIIVNGADAQGTLDALAANVDALLVK